LESERGQGVGEGIHRGEVISQKQSRVISPNSLVMGSGRREESGCRKGHRQVGVWLTRGLRHT
jgi:hypothetical protein